MGLVASAEEEKRCRVPQLAHGPGPAVQAPIRGARGREEGKGVVEEVAGARGGREEARGIGPREVLGQGAASCSATLLSHPPPASVQRAPTSLRQEPDLLGRRCLAAQPQPPACSVCFLSHFAKCLLIFSTKSRCLPRDTRVSTHYGRKRIQPPALTNK